MKIITQTRACFLTKYLFQARSMNLKKKMSNKKRKSSQDDILEQDVVEQDGQTCSSMADVCLFLTFLFLVNS